MALSLLARPQAVVQERPPVPAPDVVDASVRRTLASTQANGLAIATIDSGRVSHVEAFGVRNAAHQPLQVATIMYGASLTKLAFTYVVLQLVDQGSLGLDTPIADVLERPLPEYEPYATLASDPRWRTITPRMALTHSTGFANFAFVEPDHKVHIHFDPGSRYAYSGEGMLLLQFAVEHGRKEKGLGLDVHSLTDRVFRQLGMTRTSMMWRPDFADDLADGWNDKGEPQAHDQRSSARVAGSMDTTIEDMATFASALVRGAGLSATSRAEMVRPQLAISTAHQFPTLAPELPVGQRRKDLQAGLGVVTFDGPEGRGFYKGGHDAQTANTLVCLERGRRCVVILSNDVRAEAGFEGLVRLVLGDTGVPYDWEYGDRAGKSD